MAGLSGGSLGLGAKPSPSLACDLCPQGEPVQTCAALESVPRGGDGRLQSSTETRATATAAGGHRAAQGSWFPRRAPKQPSSAPAFGDVWSSAGMSLRLPGLRRLSSPGALLEILLPGLKHPSPHGSEAVYPAPWSWVQVP